MPLDDTPRNDGGTQNDDLATVIFFLRGAAEAGQMFNSYSGRAAFDAFARLVGHDPATLWDQTR